MTMLVSKFQRILGLKIHEKYQDNIKIENEDLFEKINWIVGDVNDISSCMQLSK